MKFCRRSECSSGEHVTRVISPCIVVARTNVYRAIAAFTRECVFIVGRAVPPHAAYVNRITHHVIFIGPRV